MKTKLSICLALCTIAAPIYSISFSDGIFTDSDWTLENMPTGASAQSGAQVASGGNPGEFRQVNTISNSFTYMANLRTAFTYDPSVSGAISFIDWGIDTKNISAFGLGMGYGLAIKQGGNYYGGPHNITGSTNFNWNSLSQTGLSASSFNLNIFGSGSPDFSASGGLMTFGFFTSNGNAAGISVGYDNFRVSINPVPEPIATPILVAGIVAAMRRKKKSNIA